MAVVVWAIRYYAAMLPLFVSLSAGMVCLMLWGRGEVNRFLRDHPEIAGDSDLGALKALARRNMIEALAMIGLALAWIPLGLAVLFSEEPGGRIVFVVSCGLVGLIGRNGKILEAAARSLPCVEPLREEYERVGRSWVKKALPDF